MYSITVFASFSKLIKVCKKLFWFGMTGERFLKSAKISSSTDTVLQEKNILPLRPKLKSAKTSTSTYLGFSAHPQTKLQPKKFLPVLIRHCVWQEKDFLPQTGNLIGNNAAAVSLRNSTVFNIPLGMAFNVSSLCSLIAVIFTKEFPIFVHLLI